MTLLSDCLPDVREKLRLFRAGMDSADAAKTPQPADSGPQGFRTLRLRIKDKHAKFLGALAYDVNQVWNFCNELSAKVFERERRFMSGFDLQKYTSGAVKEGLRLHSH